MWFAGIPPRIDLRIFLFDLFCRVRLIFAIFAKFAKLNVMKYPDIKIKTM
jgi:hypothetical protein